MTTFRPLPSCHSYLAPHILHSIDLITNVQQSFLRFLNHCSQLASILISNLVKQSNIKLTALADKEGKMDALLALVKSLNKNQTYRIKVEMKNLDKYPLKDIKAKLAFGRGRSVVNK